MLGVFAMWKCGVCGKGEDRGRRHLEVGSSEHLCEKVTSCVKRKMNCLVVAETSGSVM